VRYEPDALLRYKDYLGGLELSGLKEEIFMNYEDCPYWDKKNCDCDNVISCPYKRILVCEICDHKECFDCPKNQGEL
jgi:hypothetical protein